MLRALIVEDEPGSRDRLRRLLGRHRGEIEIVGEADSGPRALEVISELRPDMVFLDVSLPGFDGFALLDEIDLVVKIIFTTASHDHAVRAFDAGAIHYLLKPIDPEQLQEALARVQRPAVDPGPAPAGLARLLCRDRDTTHVLRTQEVLFLKADQGYTLVRTGAKEYLTNDSLGTLEEQLRSTFVRIHRNALVNVAQVSSFRHLDGDVIVVLRNGMELPVSRRHAQGLRERLLYGAD
jgi:two-component system LytT family response regulator